MLQQMLLHHLHDGPRGQGMEIGAPIRHELRRQTPPLPIPHPVPLPPQLVLPQGEVAAELGEQEGPALRQGLVPLLPLGVRPRHLLGQGGRELGVAGLLPPAAAPARRGEGEGLAGVEAEGVEAGWSSWGSRQGIQGKRRVGS